MGTCELSEAHEPGMARKSSLGSCCLGSTEPSPWAEVHLEKCRLKSLCRWELAFVWVDM